MTAPGDNANPPGSGAEPEPAVPPGRSVFRWPALFQQCDDALFLLDRRRRLLFVNAAWEALAGVALAEVRGLACRRVRPAAPSDAWTDILAHALCPPREITTGRIVQTRRLLPSRAGPRWWDVAFFPLGTGASRCAILGRVHPVAVPAPVAPPLSLGPPPLPEKLVALRERSAQRHEALMRDGETPALRRLTAQVRLAASVTIPILLTGPPGSGKRTLARLIHFQSAGRERACAVLDATRLPPAALAAVLFGDGGDSVGTIYVHEPGRLSPEFQARLVERLADADPEQPLPRLLVGCCGDPLAEVRAGRLLDDLYTALSALTIVVPPLCARGEELPRFVATILERLNEDGERAVHGLTPDAWEVLRAHTWPGNLRELFAVLASARDHATGEHIGAGDLPAPLRLSARLAQTPEKSAERALPLEKLLVETERRLIALALRRAGGQKGKAAELLGIWRQRLVRRMEALGLSDDKEEGE